MRRAFISSVMRGFGKERDAARRGVDAAGLEPATAENLSAQPFSPQSACLEGVRQSDAYVGILGERYGSATSSGLSPTEEEFREARERGIPIFWFVKECRREPKQQEFFQRISGYEEGYHLKFFETPEQLHGQVTKALRDYLGSPRTYEMDTSTAARRLKECVTRVSPSSPSEPWFGAAVVPVLQGEPYLSVAELEDQGFMERLEQAILFGESALFPRELGITRQETETSLVLSQQDNRGTPVAQLECHTDGVLAWASALRTDETGTWSLAARYVVDEQQVAALLIAFACYSRDFYTSLRRSDFIASLHVLTFLRGMAMRYLGRPPRTEPQGISVPMQDVADPIYIPSEPLEVPRARFSRPAKLSEDLMRRIKRWFRVNQRYYEAP